MSTAELSTVDRKPHLSPTQLEMFCRCPESYRRRYVEGEVIPPGIALLKGSGFHRGAELNLRQKIDSHVDLAVSDIVDAAVQAFQTEAHGGISLTDDEAGRGSTVVMAEAVDDLASLAQAHAEQQAPEYQPVFVEELVRIPLPRATHDLLGVIDVADDKDRVTDFKTSSRSKTQDDVDYSTQLTVYAASFATKTGRRASEVRLDSIVKTKTRIGRQLLSSTRSDDDFTALAHRINVVTAALQAGIFTPAVPGAWWCSARFCGFHSTCPFVNPKRRYGAQGD